MSYEFATTRRHHQKNESSSHVREKIIVRIRKYIPGISIFTPFRWMHFALLVCLGAESPYVQDWPAQNFVQNVGLIGRGRRFGRLEMVRKKRHQNTRRTRVTCPCRPRALQRVGVRVRIRVRVRFGVERSRPTCKIGIGHTRPAHKFCAKQPCR